MKKLNKEDINQDVFDLYDDYAHNKIGRRQFLEKLSLYAIGGITVSSLLSFISPNYVDNLLVNHFCNEFKRKYKLDLTESKKSMRRLKTACERAKRTLSSGQSASIELDSLFDGIDFFTSISRAKFESLCMNLFQI